MGTTKNLSSALMLYVNGRRIVDMPESDDRFIWNLVGQVATTEGNSFGAKFTSISNSLLTEITIKVVSGSSDDAFLDALCTLFFTTGVGVLIDGENKSLGKHGIAIDCDFQNRPQDQWGSGTYIKEYVLRGIATKFETNFRS